MLALVERACARASDQSAMGRPLHLTSGAFHDAMYLAEHCPTAMIFVPSKGGISHNAAEETAPHDLALGAQALLPAHDHGWEAGWQCPARHQCLDTAIG
ncbi:M20/M25/M40 family metallo-hydrolase [Cupriavidus sp. D39]|uniref:M20/M25/M40 family metallo-hydrolase n=1 Tax=Cupriavidus sp. D39 TaxID=2997877 RepID=UPI003B642521